MFSQIQSPFEEIDGMSIDSNYYYYPTYEKPSNKWIWWIGIIAFLALIIGFIAWERGSILKKLILDEGHENLGKSDKLNGSD